MARPQKFAKVMFYTCQSVSHSVHRGVSASVLPRVGIYGFLLINSIIVHMTVHFL